MRSSSVLVCVMWWMPQQCYAAPRNVRRLGGISLSNSLYRMAAGGRSARWPTAHIVAAIEEAAAAAHSGAAVSQAKSDDDVARLQNLALKQQH